MIHAEDRNHPILTTRIVMVSFITIYNVVQRFVSCPGGAIWAQLQERIMPKQHIEEKTAQQLRTQTLSTLQKILPSLTTGALILIRFQVEINNPWPSSQTS